MPGLIPGFFGSGGRDIWEAGLWAAGLEAAKRWFAATLASEAKRGWAVGS